MFQHRYTFYVNTLFGYLFLNNTLDGFDTTLICSKKYFSLRLFSNIFTIPKYVDKQRSKTIVFPPFFALLKFRVL